MRRGAKPAKDKAEAKLPVARKTRKSHGAERRDLEKRLAEALKDKADALRDKAEARDQQTATSEILKIIRRSPSDVQPVFDMIAESAARLCDGIDVTIFLTDSDVLRVVAHKGPIPSALIGQTRPMIRGTTAGRAVLDRRTIHVADVQAETDEYPEGSVRARRLGHRTILVAPLLHVGEAIGAIVVRRTEVRPFTDRQIDLLQTFAEQAVIAIENVRLFKELEARNRDLTATGEILRVIASSPTDVQPVLDAVAESAAHLCDAPDVSIFLREPNALRVAARHGSIPSDTALPLNRETGVGVAVLDGQTIHVADMQTDVGQFPVSFQNARRLGFRTALNVPLMREGVAIGAISLRRTEAHLFTDQQVSLLEAFADQAVIAIENVRLFTELQASNADLTDALSRQTATSEILRVISSSPTDAQPVFEAIAASAVRLCGAVNGAVFRFDGELIHIAAYHNISGAQLGPWQRQYPATLESRTVTARAILRRATVQVEDLTNDPWLGHTPVAQAGYRTVLSVPMMRDGLPIGAVNVVRMEVQPFSQNQLALLQTFADQAVIAIENVRLFKELEARNTELTETLARQMATGEVLRAISQAQTDAQPVFEIIAASARRLSGADYAQVQLYDGELIHLAALESANPEGDDAIRAVYPLRVGDGSAGGRAIGTRAVTQIPDLLDDQAFAFTRAWPASGLRSLLAVPMLKDGAPVGVIAIGRTAPGLFPHTQVDLLKTFADQAVIAIENVRLFTELQTSNRELTTALDTQTATSDILRVISQSQTDVQPVFDAILASAVRLLGAYAGALSRIVGDQIELAALMGHNDAGDAAVRSNFPYSLESEGSHARAIRDRAPLNIADVPAQAAAGVRDRTAWPSDIRSLVVVPMLLHDEAVGAIGVTRREPGGFTDDEIALLQTFADQAVIAIENVRLFRELEARTQDLTRSVDELRALGEVGQAISSTLDLQTVLSMIVARATQLAGADAGVIYEYDEEREVFVPRATEHLEAEIVETMLATPVRKGEGATGRLAEVPEPIQVPDILAAPAESRVRGALVRAGYRALLAVPLVREDHLLGGLTVIRKATGAFAPEVIELLRTFATQSALAIQNARLFLEIEDKSRQLEAASQHKSEFLANMSHELRTPLNAIIGFSEVLGERMFGELNEKQEEYLKDIYASGQHLLSLINDILDLSKIEAGRMELELTDFNLPATLDNALTLVRERAGRRGIALGLTIDERLEQIRADERKVRQVVLNLLSNAIKFTLEGGRIEVRAVPVDGMVEISVSDTGVGIAPEDQEAIFEEFKQVGTAAKKVEGTGLGLALSRKFVELHGGRIWVESELGVGSTFTFRIPVRRGE